ncbi:transglutaminase domain-containing protein [Streptomyces sp. NPDC059740]|uniref:transglutaminase domain-containing protein n=1 Tax=Streptomyces sp. NPDC059740 TaxID=3346926 RepID=UPI003656BD04
MRLGPDLGSRSGLRTVSPWCSGTVGFEAVEGHIAARLRLFEAVRAVPYGTDGAHDAESLMGIGRGDCLAKSAYLTAGFRRLGFPARRVRWLYLLPDQPPEVRLLPSREDVHSATEVLIGGRWVLVDATHDPALAPAGLTVAAWDGVGDTVPAYPPLGPVWRPGAGPEPVPNAGRPAASDLAGRRYQVAFNRWLWAVRASGRASSAEGLP